MGIKRKVLKISKIFICIIFLVLYFFALFVNYKFGDISFEQLIFNIIYSEGANFDAVYEGVIYVGWRVILVIIIFYLIYFLFKEFKIKILYKFYFNGNEKKINITKPNFISYIVFMFLLGYFCLSNTYAILNLDQYIESQKNSTTLFEDYYVDSRNIKLEFPEKKRNLIHIFLESMESTNVSINNGGVAEKSYIPNLETIAINNINFSNTDKIGGAIELNNTNWTIAGMIAQTSGLPLKISMEYEYNEINKSLPGIYSIGDILKENGYNNYLMIGSNAEYGGRKQYFEYHGNYKIYDYIYAKENNLIDDDYYVWWGYEDTKLFEFAKKNIKEASKQDKPFNFTILTVDTHMTDGYMDDSCKEIFNNKYANSLYCSDQKVFSFINWIKKQDFYDNTTIVITGDHLTMQLSFYKPEENNRRTIYNAIINSPIKPKKEKNRSFSSFDIFPTTLASLGVKIDGNKLGFGVNLFSKEQTLLEELGVDYVNNELTKKSFYYDNLIIK